MYFCGPTAYQRIHIGNARPFVLSMWLKRWLELRGYRVTLAENVTDINDKIYDAARRLGIGSAELARRATGWYVEDTDRLGLGRPDLEPLASESVPEIVALTRELIARGLAYESGGDVYFRVARSATTGGSRARARKTWRRRSPDRSRRIRGDFALWKGAKPGEDTRGSRPGARAAGLAHRVLGDGGDSTSAPDFDIHGGGLDLRLPAPRERARPVQARPDATSPATGCTTA